ncbi:MAG: phospholipase D-like domain-containing protein, partial [Candidatus Wallbacteria bacterium]|nr:phospholipase D-like domain-containing protein [Candidatus Wallbacteria bacterium]
MRFYISVLLLIFAFSLSISAGVECQFNWSFDQISLERPIVEFIDRANVSLDISIYQLDNQGIIDAIKRAVGRLGASRVHLVTDSEYYHKDKYPGYKELEALGVKIVPDDAADGKDRGQCHHKIIIRDSSAVLTGSTNFTANGVCKNNNNIVVINDSSVVPLYQQEFNQMFNDKLFSIKKNPVSGTREFYISGIKTGIYFSPYDKIKQKFLDVIATANHSIAFCMFVFTDEDVMRAMLEKAQQGVKIYGIYDRWQANSSYSSYHTFKEKGHQVEVDRHTGLLHHKFMVVDAGTSSDPTVITGSYNLTSSAGSNNDENIIILHDGKIAQQYFDQVKKNFVDSTSLLNSVPSSFREPVLLISEVSFKDPSGDWLELYCLDDGANGTGVDISGFFFEDDSVFKTLGQGTVIRSGEFLLLLQDRSSSVEDQTTASNGAIRIYTGKTAFVSTDDQIILRNPRGDIVDAVCWSNHDGVYSRGEDKDMDSIVRNGQWVE